MAHQKVSDLYKAELQNNKDQLIGHMVGFINRFTKASTSYYLVDYNMVGKCVRVNEQEHVLRETWCICWTTNV